MDDVDRLQAAAMGDADLTSLAMTDEELLLAASLSANGPNAALVFDWLARCDGAHAATSALALAAASLDPAALADIVDALPTTSLDVAMQRRLARVFLTRAEDATAAHGVRAQALHGALLLAQKQKTVLHRLEAFLWELETDDDPHFLRHAARILGVVLAHSPEGQSLEKLIELVAVPEAEDEAAMELGLDALRSALSSSNPDAAVVAFDKAHRWFEAAKAASEDRIDADLYGRCMAILLRVHKHGFAGTIGIEISDLASVAFRYSAFVGEVAEGPSWLGIKTAERTHWTMLAAKLGALDDQFQRRIWMRAAEVVEDQLLAVYRSSRAILLRDGDTGLDLIVRPQVATALRNHRRHLDALEQWMDDNEGSPDLPDAASMRRAVDQAREDIILHRPSEAGSDDQGLLAILDAGQVPESARPGIAGMLQAALQELSSNENPILNELVHGIVDEMARNVDFRTHQAARSLFTAVLVESVYFLAYRHETGRASDPESAYLFIRSPSTLPLEAVVQRDYHRRLKMSGLHGLVQMEVSDLGAGRADVFFSASGVRTVTEVKRTFTEMDHSQLLDAYGGQTAAYQTTNVTFGFLLVLDLWDRKGIQPHLREQISVQRKTFPGQSTPYDIVVMRVQGQRRTPSDVR